MGPRALQIMSLAEAATLALLVFLAVPLKHLADYEGAVRVMGPVHGTTFLIYLWVLMQAAGAGGWHAAEVVRMIIAACVPLGGFFNQSWLASKLAAAANPGSTR